MKRSAPAAARNSGPILEILRDVVPDRGTVLEIACGTGQHAVCFAEAFPDLDWQPTDADEAAIMSARSWQQDAGLANLREPVRLDVSEQPWPVQHADAVVSINMIHISPWQCTLDLLGGAAQVLAQEGTLFLYGPYFVSGAATAPSNEAFDRSLRQRDPLWGVRQLEQVVSVAEKHGFQILKVVDMPANNLSVVFRKSGVVPA